MRRFARLLLVSLGLGWPATAMAQALPDSLPLPEVTVSGPTVIGFWLVPTSDSVLAAAKAAFD